MRTPVPIAIGYGLGLGLGIALGGLSGHQLLALTCLGIGSTVALASWQPAPRVLRWLGPKLLVVTSALLGLCLSPRAQHERLPAPGMTRLRAEVEEVRIARDGHASTRIKVLDGTRLEDGTPLPAGTHLLAVPYPLPEGARVSLLAAVRPALPFRNHSPHPPLQAAHPTRGIAKLPSASAVVTLAQPLPARVVDAMRKHVRQRLLATLPSDAAYVACAILLGDPDVLEDPDADDVRGAGLSHVFAVSGMHVTLLAGLTVWLLTQLLLRIKPLAEAYAVPRIAAGVGIPLALSIAALTGGAPSGWRASITTAIAWLVTACGRDPDATAVSAAACILFAAITPADALRPAFLLSIAATAALIGQAPPAAASFGSSLRALSGLTLRTTLATAPVVWWSFGSVPLVGLLANLLLVPVGSLLLLAAALHALLACGLPLLAPLTAEPVAIIASAFLRGASACSALDPHWALPVLSLAQGIVLSLGVCAALYTRTLRRQLQIGLVTGLVCLGCEWQLRWTQQPRDVVRATFVDVGQGDAAILDLPNGEALLIDAGGNPQGGPDPGQRALVPLLAARRRTELAAIVLTHPHPDHYGGLAAVLAAVRPREFWDSGQGEAEAELSGTSQQAADLVRLARARGVQLRRPDELCGAPRRFGAATVAVLSPCPAFDSGFDPNDNSLVLRVDYAGKSLLFTGDIEAHAEAKLLASGLPLRADVLKVPHHGSRSSSSEALLRAVQPTIAVVSAGAVNPFGHPHPEVMARLAAHARTVIDLGQHGGTTVTIERSGQLHVETSE